MTTVKIAGREWPLKFTLDAMDAIEAATGKTIDALTFRVKTRQDREELLAVLAELLRAGSPGEDTPDAALRAALTPGELMSAMRRISDAISEGMRMETDAPAEDEAVDVVLEELKKKESPGA